MLIGISIASFLVAWGLFTGKGWAWVFTMTITTISIALNGLRIVVGGYWWHNWNDNRCGNYLLLISTER